MNKKKDTVFLELHYLPCIAYFTFFNKYQNVIFEVQENYVKQSYRNRCYILSANKVHTLSVPVHRGTGKKSTKDIQIDYSQKWVANHWRAIQSAYGKAPFFEYYADRLHDILYKNFVFLIDLNWELLTYCLNELNITENNFSFSVHYEKYTDNGIYDGRSQRMLKPQHNHGVFFNPYAYEQVFGKNFVSNLSIIDLLFCVGPNARSYVINLPEFNTEQEKLGIH